MAKQKLDLLQFPAGFVAQASACAAKVVRSNIVQATFRTSGLYHAPNDLRTESAVSDALGFIDGPKYRAGVDTGGGHPVIHGRFHPAWHWNGPDVATFADHVGDYPMFFALLEAVDSQPGYFRPSKTTSQENSNHRVVPSAAQTTLVEDGKEGLPCAAVNQLPIRIPCFFTPFTRRIPAARSGLNSPESAASYASRRTAAKRRLIVDDA